MQVIHLNGLEFKRLIAHSEIEQRCKSLGNEMADYFGDEHIVCIGILNGCFMFMAELLKHYPNSCKIDFVNIGSYQGMQRGAIENYSLRLKEEIGNKHVVICEDIVDSGATVYYLTNVLRKLEHPPASIHIATLLFKPKAVQYAVEPKFVGFSIPNTFVVGFGLDYNGQGRNLPDIYECLHSID